MLVRAHLTPALGSRQLQKLSPADLNSFYAQLLTSGRCHGKGGLSPRTVRLIHVVLHRALRDAVRQGTASRNVASLSDPPRAVRHEMTCWDAGQLRTFLAATEGHRLSSCFLLLALKGLRRGEALGLRWADLDLDQGRLAIRQALIMVDRRVVVSEPKTSRSRRQLAIEPVIVAALRARRVRQAQDRLAFGPGYVDSDLVFTEPSGSWVHPQHLSEEFERLVKAAELPRIRLHDLRHTFATLALGQGAGLWQVADLLGHSSTAVTDAVYRHAIPAATQQAGALVAELLYGAEGGSR
jgi:integrase